MTAELLRQPLFLGLSLLSAGVLFFIVFVLPSLVFPAREEERSAAPPPPAPFLSYAPPPPPEPDLTPVLKEKIEAAWRPIAARLSALEDRPAPVPSASELRGFYEGLDRLKKGMDEVRALSLPLSAGARDQEALKRQVEELVRRARPLTQEGTAPEGPPARLARRLALWRRAWAEQLRAEEAALSKQKASLEARRTDLEARLAADRDRLSKERETQAADREAFARDRRRFEEEALPAALAEKARLETEARAAEERIQSLRRETTAIEERRAREAASSAEAAAAERRRAREDQERWQKVMKESIDRAAADRAAGEAALRDLEETGRREVAAARAVMGQTREALEKERAALAANEAAFKEASGREASTATARLGDLRSQGDALEKGRDLLSDTLRRDLEERAKELAALAAAAREQSASQEAQAAKAAAESQAVLDEVLARKGTLAQSLAAEKDGARRDLAALQSGAAAEREGFETSLRRAESEHRDRMAALAREESALGKRISLLEQETEKLRQRAEKLRVKASERLFRHRAAFEKSYVEARQKAEAQAVEEQDHQARERWAVGALEARLAVRRKRLEALRARRKEAVQSLLKSARAGLEAAVEAQRRTEDLVRQRVSALKNRQGSWQSLKERWASAPGWIADGTRSGEDGVEMTAAAEMAGLAATAERRGEEARRAFAESRAALESAARRLKEREADLDREETDVRQLLNAVADQSSRLERLRVFFEAARLPPAAAQDRSQVA